MPLYHQVVEPVKGRCAVASAPIRAGQRVLSSSAVCAVSSCCGACFSSAASLSRCTGCRRARYCSRKCQQRDWPQHRRECAAWKSIPPTVQSPTVLLVARLSAKLFLDGDNVLEHVTQLRDHLGDHGDAKLAQFKDMTQLVLLLLSRWKMQGKDAGTKSLMELQQLEPEILKLFGRVNCNAFSIANDVTNEAVGIGLFPEGALFNHGCDPNCVVSFQGQQMQVHAVKDVQTGQELTVSYIELLQSTPARRKELKESYFFDCTCTRCQAALEGEKRDDWWLDGFACGNKDCQDGVVTLDGSEKHTVCKRCGHRRDWNEMQRYEHELEAAEALDASSEESRWRKHQRVWEIARYKLQLHPRSTRLATMAREVGNFLVRAQSLELKRQALPFFLAELHAVEWLLPNTKLPSRGLLHFQIGRLLFEEANAPSCNMPPAERAKQLEEASKHLQEALIVLDCANGGNSAAVQSAQMELDEVQHAARFL